VRVALAVDPGNRHTGIACATQGDMGTDIDLVALAGITLHAGDVERSVRERIVPALLDATGKIPVDGVPALAHLPYVEVQRDVLLRTLRNVDRVSIWFEEPPDYSRSDVRHGSEARIGYAEGWLSGLVAGQMGLPTRRVAVSAWRETMIRTCVQRGLYIVAPSRRMAPTPLAVAAQCSTVTGRPGGGFVRTFTDCGHAQSFASFADLKRSTGICATCAVPVKTADPANWVRDEWKRIACQGIQRFWPELYASLVAAARGRRRAKPGEAAPTEVPDHQVAGIADACEAAWIAVHALSVPT
jgi:hypothetical protein